MNEHQRRRQEVQAASQRFLQALSAGQAAAVDRQGNRIDPGCRLLFKTPIDIIFDVVSVNPVLDPNVPPGILDVIVSVTFPIRARANEQIQGAIVLSYKQDPKADPAKTADSADAKAPLTLVGPDGREFDALSEAGKAEDSETP